MNFRTSNNKTYSSEKVLGKGGEGTVYVLAGNTTSVIKIYNEKVDSGKASKLNYMVSIADEAIEKYTAWPREIIINEKNEPVGFSMRRLDNYYPVHMLFNPMDRKHHFPEKGYNFLVHVARNLSSALHALHSRNIIIGDINEGNILVNTQGMIAFIDCDSFQIRNGATYYFCDVGIPRYTPPELLRLGSFEKVARTMQTDSFSLGVLIFQLLFLGRHPFAGKNNTARDIDEDTAIRNGDFAYSITKKVKRLLPPDNAFKINYLTTDIINLFHRAFEQEQDRTLAAEWVTALGSCLDKMIVCKQSKSHVYPNVISFCPWCDFKNRFGVIYFYDDSFMENLKALGDLDKFINGFKLSGLTPKELPETFNELVEADPVPAKYLTNMYLRTFTYFIVVVIGGILLLSGYMWGVLVGTFLWSVNKASPWTHSLKKELRKRQERYVTLKNRRQQLKNGYLQQEEVNKYNGRVDSLKELLANFKNLPRELRDKRREAEELLYGTEVQNYLQGFALQQHKIPMFGAAKKAILLQANIFTAADIYRLDTEYVRGIGPKNIEYLKSWRRSLMSGFAYRPDQAKLNARYAEVAYAVQTRKLQLESEIRQGYQQLIGIKNNIETRQENILKEFNRIEPSYKKAEADLEAFEKISNRYI